MRKKDRGQFNLSFLDDFFLRKPTLLWLTLYKIKCKHLMSTVRQVLTKA